MNFFKIQVSKDGTGFTLVEMLVVVAIFSILIVAIIGVFVSAVRAQKYNLAAQQLLDQTSYAMGYTSRFLRMAKKDEGGSCTGIPGSNYSVGSGGRSIKFKNYQGECMEFKQAGGKITVTRHIGEPTRAEYDLTSADIEVMNSGRMFTLAGEQETDFLQPRVTFFLEIKAKESRPQPSIRIQATVSQRDLDFQELP